MKSKLIKFVLFLMLFLVGTRVTVEIANAQPTFPFDAWMSSHEDVFLSNQYDHLYPSIAILSYGDRLSITECRPDCTSPNSFLQLFPYGVIRRSNISITPRTEAADFLSSSPENFVWAQVRQATTTIIDTRNPGALRESFRREQELFFRKNDSLLASGFLQRANGGLVPIRLLRIFEPSSFSGWHNPPNSFLFVITDTTISDSYNRAIVSARYERFEVRSSSNATVEVLLPPTGRRIIRQAREGGTIPRSAVRLGSRHRRPVGVPGGTRWVHVDLEQQVLTAYDFNDDLVFATLVSTGRGNNETRTGIFEVRRKIIYTQMRGGGNRPYSVEGVPWTLFFDDAIALHAAFWHDQFGTKRSHGCVNLSITDAHWLFDFSPPMLPLGWHSIHPIILGIPTLWVVIE